MRRAQDAEGTPMRSASGTPTTLGIVAVLVLAAALPSTMVAHSVLWAQPARFEWARGTAGGLLAGIGGAVVIGIHFRAIVDFHAGRPPRVGSWTLAAMASVLVACTLTFGGLYVPVWAVVTTTALLVYPTQRALRVVAGVLVVVLALAYLVEYLGTPTVGRVSYLVSAVVWRTTIVFTLVWLVTAVRQLAVAREALAREATIRQRAVAEAELGTAVGHSLLDVIERGRAVATHRVDGDRVGAELDTIGETARDALTATRALVSRYRAASAPDLHVDAAVTLLEAGGWVVTTVDTGEAPGRLEDGEDFGIAVANALARAPGTAEIVRGCERLYLRVLPSEVTP